LIKYQRERERDLFVYMAAGGIQFQSQSRDFLDVLASNGVQFLLSNQGKVPLSTYDSNKTICLLFSANWCRPCKSFTPQLVQLYETLRKRGEDIEIILISFDQDEAGFNEHLKCMPWLAVPFDLDLHKKLSDLYSIKGIPSFVPLSLNVEEDLIALIEDYDAEAFPFTRKRKEELKAIDDAKRQGGDLEQLLAHDDCGFVVSKDGRKVLISQLIGKTVGLYFGAHWCPPCRAFTTQLIEAYNELTRNDFEIVLISTDRDNNEFDQNISNMPWLAIPYKDRTRQDLCRIFNIKGIPALVIIGPNGKTIRTNGKAMISLYGAKAFPFTETRISEIEASLKKEGAALANQVKDSKHEHVLKLDMARAYVCDSCKQQGRFWTFSCDVCDYDLHPLCVEEES
jgi:nucleoredoxin